MPSYHEIQVFCLSLCEACSNETCLGIILDEGAE